MIQKSSVGRQLVGNNIYREEEMHIPITPLQRTQNTSTGIHAPEELCLTIVDSAPDHHFQHINNDYKPVRPTDPPTKISRGQCLGGPWIPPVYIIRDKPLWLTTEYEKVKQEELIKKYQILYKAALKDDWLMAKRILKANPEAITAKITNNEETVLHVAAASRHSMFVDKLNCEGETMLHAVAAAGFIGAARFMVDNNSKLTQIPDAYGWVPLVTAVYTANPLEEKSKKMVQYLCKVTRDEEPSPYSGDQGGALICITIARNLFDIALNLVQQHPNLATQTNESKDSALQVMAGRPSLFLSGNKATTWERFLRSCQ
ncbi:hypothetical protein MKX01_027653 [Papaver californicum]|nr:hypothetical protein MKX01_027653 [Papaver californicum]